LAVFGQGLLSARQDVPLRSSGSNFFQRFLQRFSSVHMQGLGLVQASSGLPGTGLSLTADLTLVQKQALAHKGRDNRFQVP
jgi:hypothetical protein